MKALVLDKPNDIHFREVETPIAQQGEVRIKIEYCGICGSDVHIMGGHIPMPYPLTMGHEFSGVVDQIGEGVANIKIGDRVTATPFKMVNGEPHGVGFSDVQGAMAEYVCIQEPFVHKLPNNVTFEEGALIEPACVAAHAVFEFGKILPGHVVAVMGAGPIGLMCAIMAKATGAKVVLIGRSSSADRLALGKKLAADYTFMTDRDNVIEEINKLTNQKGADLVIDAAGTKEIINTSIAILKNGGTMIEVALPNAPIEVETFIGAVAKEICIQCAFCHIPDNWSRVIKLLEDGIISFEGIATHKFSLAEFETAFKTRGIKILLRP